MANLLERADAQLDELLRGWNFLTFIILTVLLIILVYPLLIAVNPDTHPLLLSRQANVSSVRQPGESAIHRGLEVSHGYPLKTGLNVRDADTPKYAEGKDGDLRSIWRQAVNGELDSTGKPSGMIGKIMTVRGTEKATEHDLANVSKEINSIGQYVKQKGANYVAIYLPNSIELLTVVFAAAFYGFHPVMIPYGKPKDVVLKLLRLTEADFLIAAAGLIPATDVQEQCSGVKEVMWVVEETSRDVDWTDASENTSTWHDIVDEHSAQASSELPTDLADDKVPDIITIWLDESPTSGELVAFSQKNIVAAVAAQVTALPRAHRFSTNDLFLPADALTTPAVLVLTLAALFSNASVALSSVSGFDVPLSSVAPRLSPTIIVGTSTQAFQLHEDTSANITSTSHRYVLSSQRSALQSGIMPHAASSLASKVTTPISANLGSIPGKLRLLYVLDRTNADSPPTSSARLTDVRAFTGARVIHALTTAKVAGPVAQTNLFDYRPQSDPKEPGHFGVPPACLELLVKDKGEYSSNDEKAQGELIARGPAVQGVDANLGIYAEFRDDGCLSYLFQYPESSNRPVI